MDKLLRILHLEDNPDYSELVKSMLESGGLRVDLRLVSTLADFVATLEKEVFDIILADYKLPTCNGLQALQTARQNWPGTPFLLISGTIGEQAAIESLKGGATDYVLKQWPDRLVPAVRRAVQEAQEHARLKQAEMELNRREKYFRALTENSLDVLTILNHDGLFPYNSPSLKQVLGYEPEELAGRNVFELVHPDDLPAAVQTFEKALMNPGLRITHELRYRRRDGSWSHLELIGQNRLNDPEIAGLVLNTRDITERKRAEAALQESEFSLRESQRAARIGSYVLDIPSGRWTSSSILDEIFGIDGSHAKTVASWSALIHPDEREQMTTYVAGVFANKTRFEKDYRIIRQTDGAERWVSGLGELTFDASGHPSKLIGVIHDITDRKQVEEALRERQSKLDSIFRAAPVGIGVSVDRVFTDVNDTLCQMVGYTAEELIGQSARMIYATQEDFDFVGREIYGHIAERAMHCLETRLRPKDGRVIDVLLSASAAFPGNPDAGVTFIVIDITERKQAEARLHLLSTALSSAANAIIITDRDGKVRYANPAFSRATGYSVEEVAGRNPRLLKSGTHDQAFYKNLWDTILAGRVWHAEMVNRRKDGSLFTEDCTITPVCDERGEITHFVAVKQDITEQKQLEAQLRQVQKMEAIGQLAGGVAHDFNNLLTVIHGHASLLLDGGTLSETASESAQQIARAADRAAGLTRQLLAFSRRQVLRPQLLDMNEVVHNLTKMLGRILGEDVALQLNYWPQPALVRADAGMMEQVLLNLAVNSRDAMPKGGQLAIRVCVADIDANHVARHPEARAGRFVCFAVVDNGSGIAPENVRRIFEPFFTTKEVGKGTGLGLATVYGIVRQHEGWIEVESKPGEGATFTIYLPASTESSLPVEDQALPKAVPGGTETILVVEDETPVRELTCRFLAGRGYKILRAESGTKALEVWRQRKNEVHLLLTDLIMPEGLDGRELAEKLSAERPELKVIFMSGYSADVAGKDFILRHGLRYLQKPFELPKLAAAVRDCLDS